MEDDASDGQVPQRPPPEDDGQQVQRAPQIRHVPPPVLKGPKVEDFQRYEIRLRKWQTILSSVPLSQRAVAAHYALLESENKEVVDMAESIEDSVVDHDDGINRLLAALKEHIMPKNVYEKYI